MANLRNFKTIAYAGNSKFLASLTTQLDALDLEKKVEGSQFSSNGHVITYSAKSKKTGKAKQLFFAMVNSDHEHYLIRADENLFEEVE